ncbi:MAG: ATPase, T2SS/T4P/T4SS family [Candidatus Sericytochromatia bacterium]
MIDRTVKRLLETGEITPVHLQFALEEQHITNESIIKILLKKGFITEARIKDALEIYEEEDLDLTELEISLAVLQMLPQHLIKNNKVFPLKFENNNFVLGMVDPKDLLAKDAVAMFLGKTITLQRYKLDESDFEFLMNKYSHNVNEASSKENEVTHNTNIETHEIKETEIINASIENIPIEKIVNKILENALHKKANQISSEPSYDVVKIRFKIDDTFYDEARLPRKMYQNFINHIKNLCNLEIGEHEHYSGHFKHLTNDKKEVNFVLNGIKTVLGDKLILRPSYNIPDLKNLFFYKEIYEYINQVTSKNRGLILVVGNAGSGKSTTLYSVLKHKISTKYQLMTIEDTVKYIFDNYVSQVQIKKNNTSITDLVYDVSKHNPDVLMVQEIKNEEWASLIEELALSGMLVLTSMRAYNVLSAFKRLKRINFPNFASINCIVNQKLLKRLCPYCKVRSNLTQEELNSINLTIEEIPAVYKADIKGCNKCYGGYHELIGIFEVVKMSREIINLLNNNEHQGQEITKAVNSACIMTFKEYAKRLLQDGIISFDELNKI